MPPPLSSPPRPGTVIPTLDLPSFAALKNDGRIDAPVVKKIEDGNLPTDIPPDTVYSGRLADESTSALRKISDATAKKLKAIGVPDVLSLSRVGGRTLKKAKLTAQVRSDVLRASELLKLANPTVHSVPQVSDVGYLAGRGAPGPLDAMAPRGPAITAKLAFESVGIEPQFDMTRKGNTITLKVWGTSPRDQNVPDILPEPQKITANILGVNPKAGTTYKVRVVGEDNQLLARSEFKFVGMPMSPPPRG